MSAKAFLICNTKKFKKEGFFIPMQQELIENEGLSEVSIKLKQSNFHLGFNQYNCHYDFKHNKKGIVFNKPFNYYFEPLSFYAYYNQKINLSIFQTKTDAAIDFTRLINDTGEFDLTPIEINFQKIIPLITEVAGAWIANLKRAHLKTAGYFGSNVHKSAEYKQAAEEGNVSNIQLKYISNKDSREYFVAISSKGSIILYDSLPTIEDEIELVYEIYSKLLNPHF